MAKNNWYKHKDLGGSIVAFLKSNPNKTTNQIFEGIKEKFPKICWDTVKRQLNNLHDQKLVKMMDLGRVTVWS